MLSKISFYILIDFLEPPPPLIPSFFFHLFYSKPVCLVNPCYFILLNIINFNLFIIYETKSNGNNNVYKHLKLVYKSFVSRFISIATSDNTKLSMYFNIIKSFLPVWNTLYLGFLHSADHLLYSKPSKMNIFYGIVIEKSDTCPSYLQLIVGKYLDDY